MRWSSSGCRRCNDGTCVQALGAAFQPPPHPHSCVPWRLECCHEANTERPRQATCAHEKGGSTPALRCRRWLRRGRRDGELASPVRASRLARRRPNCSRPVGNALLARTAGTDLRRLTCGDVLRQQTALVRALAEAPKALRPFREAGPRHGVLDVGLRKALGGPLRSIRKRGLA